MSRLSPVENPIGVIAESAPKRLRSPPNPLEVGCEPQSKAHFSLPPGPRYIVELSPDFSNSFVMPEAVVKGELRPLRNPADDPD